MESKANFIKLDFGNLLGKAAPGHKEKKVFDLFTEENPGHNSGNQRRHGPIPLSCKGSLAQVFDNREESLRGLFGVLRMESSSKEKKNGWGLLLPKTGHLREDCPLHHSLLQGILSEQVYRPAFRSIGRFRVVLQPPRPDCIGESTFQVVFCNKKIQRDQPVRDSQRRHCGYPCAPRLSAHPMAPIS